jgi:signal transduction histidine kinase
MDWINREIARLRMSPEREDGQRVELTGALGDLAGGFALLGIHPHLDLPDHIADLPTKVAIVVLEIVNEALTNVMKHSTDDAPVIVVTVAHHTVEVTVTNRYDGAPSTHRGTGSLALVERARTVGGTVEMWQADGHFHLGATLPVSAGGRAHLPGAAS